MVAYILFTNVTAAERYGLVIILSVIIISAMIYQDFNLNHYPYDSAAKLRH